MADEKSPWITTEESGKTDLNQILLDNMDGIALLLRPSSREIVASNQAAIKVGAIPGAKCFATWGQRETPCPWCLAPALWETGKPQHQEVEADGVVWDAHWIPIGPDLYMHYAYDITERKRAEAALRESEARFRSTFDQSPVGNVIVDQDLRFHRVNPAFCQLIGYTEEELASMSVADIVHPEDLPKTRQELRGVATGEIDRFRIEERNIRQDGAVIWIDLSVNLMSGNGDSPSYYLAVVQDITAHKQAEELLQEGEKHYRSLFENMLNGFAYCQMIFEQDRPQDFIYLKVNEAFEALTGLKNVKGKRVSEVIPGIRESDPQLFETYGRVALTGIPERFETYVEALGMWFSISVYSPQKEHFVAVFDVITERKLAEEALRQAEERYRSIFENAVEGIFQSTPEGRYIGANPAMAKMFGYESPEELMAGITDIKTQVYVDPQRRVEFGRLMARDGFVKDFEYQIHRKDGGNLWISDNARAIRNDQGDIVAFEGFVQDISERKEAERELSRLRRHQALILNSAWEGILGLDLKGNITFVNPAAARLFGYEAGELLGRNGHAIWHHSKLDGSSHPVEECPIHMALPTGKAHYGTDKAFWRQDGTSFTVEYALAPILELGEVIGGVLTFRDISQQQEDQALTRSLITGSPVGIYLLQNGKFVLTNQSFHTVTGYDEKELSTLDFWKLVHPEDREAVRTNALKMLRGERSTPYEYRNITNGGEIKWIMETVTPIQYKGKKATLGYFMDISEHKQLENQFLHAQKMEAVGRLAGGVAHDFNNMLGAIMGYADMMMMTGLRPDDPLYRQAEGIRKAADRGAALTRQLLAFSRKQVLQPQVINLNSGVTDLEKMLRRLIGEDIDLTLSLSPDLASVKIDLGQMEQIILNLAINARDAMPQGGKLTIETRNVYLDEAYTAKHFQAHPGSYVMLAVSDNGTGIDAETQAHIFEPFFTTKEVGKGTGLGLSTAFGIVKHSGGHVEVYSELGRGTTFKIYLPAVEEVAAPLKPKLAPEVPLGGSETILIVEDDEMLRALIRDILDRQGYQVLEARHGGETLLLYERYPGPIHLMLTDVVMPQMSGRELAERLAPLRPEMKVLFMSGYTEDAIVLQELLGSSMLFLQKPFSNLDLMRSVRRVLDLKGEEASQCSK